MKRWILFGLALCLGLRAQAQQEAAVSAPDARVVVLEGKDTLTYPLSQPLRFLSQRALEKRQRFHIPVTYEDIPVHPAYLDTLRRIDTSLRVLTSSKWFNYVVLGSFDTLGVPDSLWRKVEVFPWVRGVYALHKVPDSLYAEWTGSTLIASSQPQRGMRRLTEDEPDTTGDLDYWGATAPQLACLNGLFLHRRQYTGNGMLVAVLDGGFARVDSLERFSAFRQEGRLRAVKDVTLAADSDFFSVTETHGQKVLSIMAVKEPYQYIGSAPDADYLLIRTEVSAYEDRIEEYLWVAGAEYADSAGADVVNSSLGYTTFDTKEQNHYWTDLSGTRSVASIAAGKMTHKGCIVNVAAGNEGKNTWRFYGVPSDAPEVLCIAAMNTDSLTADFSSRGISFWKKPDIASVGWGTMHCDEKDEILPGNGTSFASPLNAGLTACLWQAFPEKTAVEVMEAVRQSAHTYPAWNDTLGYGVPDYEKAYRLLKGGASLPLSERLSFDCSPNPTEGPVRITAHPEGVGAWLYVYDASGKRLLRRVVDQTEITLDLQAFPAGTYWLLLSGNAGCQVRQVVKK